MGVAIGTLFLAVLWFEMVLLTVLGTADAISTQCLEKLCELLSSERRLIFINFDKCWQKDDKEAKIMRVALILYLI